MAHDAHLCHLAHTNIKTHEYGPLRVKLENPIVAVFPINLILHYIRMLAYK